MVAGTLSIVDLAGEPAPDDPIGPGEQAIEPPTDSPRVTGPTDAPPEETGSCGLEDVMALMTLVAIVVATLLLVRRMPTS